MSRSLSDPVGNLIVKLKNESSYAKRDEHLKVIPRRADDLIVGQVFAYYGSDRKRVLFNPATCVCIELDSVKFFPMLSYSYRKLQDSETSVLELIEYQKIYPFMLFVNNRFIPWENINLITSYGKYYLFIHDLNAELTKKIRTVTSANMIILNSNIAYAIMHQDPINDPNMRVMFSFNDMGAFDLNDCTHTIYHLSDKVQIGNYVVNNGVIFDFKADAKYKYYDDNFYFFTAEGLYSPNSHMEIMGGQAKPKLSMSSGSYVFIASNEMTPSIDNLSKVNYTEVKEDINKELTNTFTAPDYIRSLRREFELTMSKDLSYEENRSNAIDYILNYRTDLFYELYEMELDFFTIEISNEWISLHRDSDGYLNIPRRSSNGKDYSIIMMVNGELYSYYRHHFYKSNRFICPVTDITDDDRIELLFFKNIEDYNFTIILNGNEDFMPLNTKYFNDDTILFCKETQETYFEFPADGDQHFPVPYTYETNENGFKKIIVDPFYYGKELLVASNSSFRYFGYHINSEEDDYYKVSLSTSFMYCNDYDRYLIFHNGRRLNNDQYRLTIPCRPTTPFYRFEVYLTVPLTYNDRLDVFYLPSYMRDIDNCLTIDASGSMTVDKSALEYICASNLYTFWVNGKKIPLSAMKDVDSLTIQLTEDIKSLKHVKITKMGKAISEIEDAYKNIDSSIFDRALSEHPNKLALLGITPASTIDVESDIYLGSIPMTSLMLELVREHYLENALVDTTGAFIYDYLDQDTTIFDGNDPAGNAMIDVANANRTDNLNIDRYDP